MKASWLYAAMVAGALLAAQDILRRPAAGLPEGVVARVGKTEITEAELERAVAGVASTRRAPVDAELRARVLERLIDEALLVERGVSLGLVRAQPALRAAVTQAVLDWVTAREGPPATPPDTTLRVYFEQNQAYFRPPLQLKAELRTFEGPGARAAAEAAAAAGRLDGATLVQGSLPQVHRRFGGHVAEALLEAPMGSARVLPIATGAAVVRVTDRHQPEVEFEDVRTAVLARWRTEEGDRRLRAFLREARESTPVVHAEPPR